MIDKAPMLTNDFSKWELECRLENWIDSAFIWWWTYKYIDLTKYHLQITSKRATTWSQGWWCAIARCDPPIKRSLTMLTALVNGWVCSHFVILLRLLSHLRFPMKKLLSLAPPRFFDLRIQSKSIALSTSGNQREFFWMDGINILSLDFGKVSLFRPIFCKSLEHFCYIHATLEKSLQILW